MEGGYQVLVGLWLMLGVCSFECARVLHETLLLPVFMYGSEIMLWMEEERSRIRDKGEWRKVEMKGFKKMFSNGLVMWRGWRMRGLPRGFM